MEEASVILSAKHARIVALAAIALSQRVLSGTNGELEDYLGFLSGGSSKFPLELLRGAGVDMEKPQPVETALKYFEKLVGELDELL